MSKHNKHHKMAENKEINEQEEVLKDTPQEPQEEATATIETSEQPQETADWQQKAEQAEAKCAELSDQKLRMMAEFDNYRRRTNKEKLDLLKTAGESIFKDMLPLIDDFERALKAMQDTDDIAALREGIELIYSKFNSFLQKHEVEVIPTEDAAFNTEIHEAITTFPAPSEEQKGKVIECTQKGYTLSGKVIRFAKVVVGE